jgi:ElaB/YqjD/DUF883 family membrane-anchored ribosome-binding protein
MSDTRMPAQGAADLDTPPATTEFQPAEPLKNAGAEFQAEGSEAAPGVTQTLKDNAAKVTGQAGDKARSFAEQGKVKITEQLGQLVNTIDKAAAEADDKLPPQVGQYVRQASATVQGFADRIDAKDVDELVEDVRSFVRQSPGVAIGAAAAVGFVLARLVQSGLEHNGEGRA